MVKVHQLQAKLKALRLGGMLDTLELRLDQAQQGKLGYLQFLEFMLEDETSRRTQRSLTSRISKAHFEEIKTLEEFDFSFNPGIPAEKIRDHKVRIEANDRGEKIGETVVIVTGHLPVPGNLHRLQPRDVSEEVPEPESELRPPADRLEQGGTIPRAGRNSSAVHHPLGDRRG